MVEPFMDMVWKAHTKVSFGQTLVDDKQNVIIWYCPGTEKSDYTDHKNQVGASCVDADSMNTCFNEVVISAHNELRYKHTSDSVESDSKLGGKL